MCENFVAEDRVCNLGGVHEVHLQKTSLQMAMLRLVVLKSVQEERGGLLDHVL